jgi:hypothetical protein
MFAFCILYCYIGTTTKQKGMIMNINTQTPNNSQNKKQKVNFAQPLLLLVTGFLLSLFVLLNVLYAQNPLGGWVTPFGNAPTSVLLSVCLLGLIACLVSLWRSATTNHAKTNTRLNGTPRSIKGVNLSHVL